MQRHKSARARRMERRHNRTIVAKISLVAMVDIVTILVFFLLINTTSTAELPSSDLIVLPQSMSLLPPAEEIVVMVTAKDVIVQGRAVATTAEVQAMTQDTIPELTAELNYQSTKSQPTINPDGSEERALTVMADRNVPYEILKKVMVTCSAVNYSKISLAVLQKEEKVGS